jgi:hypothetical protein
VKICNTCNVEKPLSEYPISHNYARNRCLTCVAQTKKAWRLANPEKIAQENQRRVARREARKKGEVYNPVRLSSVFTRGKRCWCCRREATKGMLCGKCAR